MCPIDVESLVKEMQKQADVNIFKVMDNITFNPDPAKRVNTSNLSSYAKTDQEPFTVTKLHEAMKRLQDSLANIVPPDLVQGDEFTLDGKVCTCMGYHYEPELGYHLRYIVGRPNTFYGEFRRQL